MRMRHTGLTCLAPALTLVLLVPALAGAKEYPSDTIHFVVPWPAGGGTDVIARGFAAAMEPIIKQTVVTDNVVGAGGVTGCLQAAKAKPDGYTILLNGSSDMTTALAYRSLPFSLDDFTYIGGFYDTPTWILAHKDRGYADFRAFLEAAKAKPGNITLGSATPAGAQALMAAAIKGVTGLNFRIIPYQGGDPMRKALLSNEVDAGIIHSPVMLPEVKEGLIRVLATGLPLQHIVYEPVRHVPTLKSLGIPIEIGIIRGLFVPKATPKEIVTKITQAAEQSARSEAFRNFGEKFGFLPVWIPGPQFEQIMRNELALFKDIKAKYIDPAK